MSRFRKRHCRPTRTAGILPALIRRYTVRRLTRRYSSTCSVVRNVSSVMIAVPSCQEGQIHGHDRSAGGVIRRGDDAAVILDDAIGDGHAEAGPLADVLRRVERLEDTRERFVANT